MEKQEYLNYVMAKEFPGKKLDDLPEREQRFLKMHAFQMTLDDDFIHLIIKAESQGVDVEAMLAGALAEEFTEAQ